MQNNYTFYKNGKKHYQVTPPTTIAPIHYTPSSAPIHYTPSSSTDPSLRVDKEAIEALGIPVLAETTSLNPETNDPLICYCSRDQHHPNNTNQSNDSLSSLESSEQNEGNKSSPRPRV